MLHNVKSPFYSSNLELFLFSDNLRNHRINSILNFLQKFEIHYYSLIYFMPDPFVNFNLFIKKQVEISDAELDVLNKSCESISFPKGHILIKAGEKQENLYFIVKGIVRNFIDTNEGEIKIYNFRIENMQVTGYAPYNYADELKALVSV